MLQEKLLSKFMSSSWLAVIHEKPDSRELKDMKLEKKVMMMILFPACSFVSLLLGG